MTNVVSVKFKDGGRVYYFDPAGIKFHIGDKAIVETANGISLGVVTQESHLIDDANVVSPLKKAIRIANEKDLKRLEENEIKQKEALKVAEQKIAEHRLDMKLVNVEYAFDGSKITFYFTADGRIDFRELVKSLAAHFHTRIELRQIGVRDEARMLGGIGICGQPYCCKRFLDDFQPVSIKMAKEQSLSLNPTKISGSCGRLMCCLKYEQNSYEYLMSVTPPVGSFIKSSDGEGVVIDSNLITGSLTVKPKGEESVPFKTNRSFVTYVSKGKQKKNADAQIEDENDIIP